jgi:16S rRNA G966 N2-methylase RsmD
VAFCDPPYAFCDWGTLLGALDARVAVLESSSTVEVPEGWEVMKSRRYGGTLVTVARTTASDGRPENGHLPRSAAAPAT